MCSTSSYLSTMSLVFPSNSIEHLVVQQRSRKTQILFVLVMKFPDVSLKGKDLGLSTSTLAVNFTRVYANGLCACDCVLRVLRYASFKSIVSLTDSADDRRVAPHRSAATWHLPTRTRTRNLCLVDRRSRLSVNNARLH